VCRTSGRPNSPRSHHRPGALVDIDAARAITLDFFGVIEVADHVVPVGDEVVPLEPWFIDAGRALCFRADLGCAQQGLAWDTRVIGALATDEVSLATDQVSLDQRDPHAAFGEPGHRDLPRRTGADYDRVVAVRHP